VALQRRTMVADKKRRLFTGRQRPLYRTKGKSTLWDEKAGLNGNEGAKDTEHWAGEVERDKQHEYFSQRGHLRPKARENGRRSGKTR